LRFVMHVKAEVADSQETTMQFVLMIYQGTTPLPGTDAWKALPEQEQKRIYTEYGEINKTPGITPGLPLGLPKDAKTVRVSSGRTQVANGPYADAERAVGAYFVFEADGIEAAVQLASRIPAARLGGAVEVRPVARYW
jgi:hypothetical protein